MTSVFSSSLSAGRSPKSSVLGRSTAAVAFVRTGKLDK
jgi:hypothetical protein